MRKRPKREVPFAVPSVVVEIMVIAKPQHSVDASQPFRSVLIRTSAAAGSRR